MREKTKAFSLTRLQHSKVLVVGLARSGVAAARVLRRIGAVVKATDIKPREELGSVIADLSQLGVAIETGGHTRDFAKDCDLIVLSPGVPLDIPLLTWARSAGKTIISEVELAYCLSNAKFVAVTGTNGKSTTVSLIGHILEQAGRKVLVAGNIGNPVSEAGFGLDQDWTIVTEVSSYQLDTCLSFAPSIAILLNITPDHLDRYDSFDSYAKSKARIFMNQDQEDIAILNYDDPICVRLAPYDRSKVFFFSISTPLRPGAFLRGERAIVAIEGQEKEVFSTDDLKVRGPHNVANCLAAALAASLLDVPCESQRKAFRSFSGLEHRMESIAQIQGVEFINDSKATNPDAVRFALQAMTKPVVLIAGGRDKNADFSVLSDLVRSKVKTMIVIGESSEKLELQFGNLTSVVKTSDLDEAVKLGFGLAQPDGVVLLSPGCASFDMFRDFEHRGEVFKRAVLGLKEELGAMDK